MRSTLLLPFGAAKLGAVVVALALGLVMRARAEVVEFPGPEFQGKPVKLTAFYTTPEGTGPHPVVVLMPSGSGTWSNDARWAEQFNEWGFAALRVESLTPRGYDDMFDRSGGGVGLGDLAQDLAIAIDWLRSKHEIERDRIYVAGWSAGAAAVLIRLPRLDSTFVAGAIAIYPPCKRITRDSDAVPVRLLLIVGNQDPQAPAAECARTYAEQIARGAIEFVQYPHADHLFDAESVSAYRPADAKDAVQRVRRFLTSIGPDGKSPSDQQ